jgi:hypothetical protein
MTTFTIDVTPEVLERAKDAAAERNTSIEHLLEESLIRLAAKPAPEPVQELAPQSEIVTALIEWAEKHPFQVDPRSYTREEINERS